MTRAEVGTAATPPAGDAVVALVVKPGQFPPDLAAGAHVVLVPLPPSGTSSSTATSAAGSGWAATVTDVQNLNNGQGSVVSVQLPDSQARQAAALPSGDVDVVLVASGGH